MKEYELPKSGIPCIVSFDCNGKQFETVAVYMHRFTEEVYAETNEYCEEMNPEDESWYWKEGWYERPFFSDGKVFKFDDNCKIISWKYLKTGGKNETV